MFIEKNMSFLDYLFDKTILFLDEALKNSFDSQSLSFYAIHDTINTISLIINKAKF